MNKKTKPTLGLIGIGLMGTALAERALQAGFTVKGYDLNSDRILELENMGGIPAASAADVASQCDWLIFSVMTTAQVETSLNDYRTLLRPNHTVIDTSTGEPDRMAGLAEKLQSQGVAYLDATIAGNSEETRRGEVLALVGGDAESFTQCLPFFNCFAKRAFHLGPAGSGARMKLVFNLVLGLHRAVLAEALSFSKRIGIPAETALNILKLGTTYSYVMDNKGTKMLTHDFAPQAKLEQHLKDVELMLALDDQSGAHLPLTAQHEKLLRKLVAEGHGSLDNSAIIKAFE